jgi:hypothetical protein
MKKSLIALSLALVTVGVFATTYVTPGMKNFGPINWSLKSKETKVLVKTQTLRTVYIYNGDNGQNSSDTISVNCNSIIGIKIDPTTTYPCVLDPKDGAIASVSVTDDGNNGAWGTYSVDDGSAKK